jgi:hypothetical protein
MGASDNPGVVQQFGQFAKYGSAAAEQLDLPARTVDGAWEQDIVCGMPIFRHPGQTGQASPSVCTGQPSGPRPDLTLHDPLVSERSANLN